MHTEDGEPDGFADGLSSSASQQNKHFQCAPATFLCARVNYDAPTVPAKVPSGRFWMRGDDILPWGR
jgi:hypothetical protein